MRPCLSAAIRVKGGGADDKIWTMSFGNFLHRRVARYLIAVLLIQLALPSWAALGASGKPGWMEICAAGGIQWVKLAPPDTTPADHQAANDHCLLCAATGATPDFDTRAHLNAELRHHAIAFYPWAGHRWYAGHSILSRAPPA